MEQKKLQAELKKNLEKGFRYAWSARKETDLEKALVFRQVETSYESAMRKAKTVLVENRHVQVWCLQKSLVDLQKNN